MPLPPNMTNGSSKDGPEDERRSSSQRAPDSLNELWLAGRPLQHVLRRSQQQAGASSTSVVRPQAPQTPASREDQQHTLASVIAQVLDSFGHDPELFNDDCDADRTVRRTEPSQ